VTSSVDFKNDLGHARYYSMPNKSKMVLTMAMIYRTAPLSMTLNDPYPDFKVTPLFDAEYIRNGTRYIVSMKY